MSPAYHRQHHAIEGQQEANLGVVLTLWDVLAGRARFPVKGAAPCATGLAGRPVVVEQAGARGERCPGAPAGAPAGAAVPDCVTRVPARHLGTAEATRRPRPT